MPFLTIYIKLFKDHFQTIPEDTRFSLLIILCPMFKLKVSSQPLVHTIANNITISVHFSVIKPIMRHKRSIHHPLHDYDIPTRAKLSEWLHGAPPRNIPETILSTIHQAASGEDRETFLDDNKQGEHKGHSDEILKYVVNSIVEDALPKVFRESIIEKAYANRVKRWMKENNTGNIYVDDVTEWLTDAHPEIVPSELDSKGDNVTTPNNDNGEGNILCL